MRNAGALAAALLAFCFGNGQRGDDQGRRGAAVFGAQFRPRQPGRQGVRPLRQAARQGSRRQQDRTGQARRRPAVRRQCQNSGHRTHHQRQSEAACRLRLLAIGDRRGAAGDPNQNSDADRQRRNGVDHQSCRPTSCVSRSACGTRPIRWEPTLRPNTAAKLPPPDLPIFRRGRIPRLRSRPRSKKPAAKSSTKSAWARPDRCRISRRSFSA